jgi:hypothetical protein
MLLQPCRELLSCLRGLARQRAHTRIQQGACEQPPQSVKDRATYSAAELARYGLPPRTAAEPFAKWARIVRAVKTRGCGSSDASSISRTQQIRHAEWAGNYANQPAPGEFYTEADMDYYIPCISAAPADLDNKDDFSAWVGLGGAYIDGSKNVVPGDYLIQTGIDAFYNENNPLGPRWEYRGWYENTGVDSIGL